MRDGLALAALFGASFLAATLVPAQSEAVLAAMVLAETHAPGVLLAVAAVANTLGACVNWWLGRQVDRFRDRSWFPLSPAALARTRAAYARWGWPSLLLSWAPFIGDPLTVAAGAMHEPLWRFVLVVGAAKTARYVAVITLAERFVG
jgi:membrane protein YqaA with SNARE-associated domain